MLTAEQYKENQLDEDMTDTIIPRVLERIYWIDPANTDISTGDTVV